MWKKFRETTVKVNNQNHSFKNGFMIVKINAYKVSTCFYIIGTEILPQNTSL